MRHGVVVALLLAPLLVAPRCSRANSVIPPPWETIVADARFIGVVECEQAGGIVAKYRVLDSWSGPRAGSHLLIAQRVDDFGEEYPLAICGEQYFFVAESAYVASRTPESTINTRLTPPVWWRGVQAQYFARWAPARIPPPHEGWSIGVLEFGPQGPGTTLESFRPAVDAFLTSDEDLLELRSLRAAAAWPYAGSSVDGPSTGVRIRSATRSDSLQVVISDLLGSAREAPIGVFVVLSTGGRSQTLRRLERMESNPFSRPELKAETIDRIRQRLGLAVATDRTRVPSPADTGVFATMRRLRGDRSNYTSKMEFDESVKRAIVVAPDSFQQFLADWVAPHSSTADSGLPYKVASFFAWRCPKPRAPRLRALLAAREPFVRVAAAVYLAYEDESGGRRALRQLMTLPGDAGAWAALTLARRGENSAMPRALDLLRDRGPYTIDGTTHRIFRKRLIELLSNSAKAASISLPVEWSPEYSEPEVDPPDLFERYNTWWHSNERRITLRDPWLEDLAVRKID